MKYSQEFSMKLNFTEIPMQLTADVHIHLPF